MLQFLPYALAAYGGYQGYRDAKDAGASGIGRLLIQPQELAQDII